MLGNLIYKPIHKTIQSIVFSIHTCQHTYSGNSEFISHSLHNNVATACIFYTERVGSCSQYLTAECMTVSDSL